MISALYLTLCQSELHGAGYLSLIYNKQHNITNYKPAGLLHKAAGDTDRLFDRPMGKGAAER